MEFQAKNQHEIVSFLTIGFEWTRRMVFKRDIQTDIQTHIEQVESGGLVERVQFQAAKLGLVNALAIAPVPVSPP